MELAKKIFGKKLESHIITESEYVLFYFYTPPPPAF